MLHKVSEFINQHNLLFLGRKYLVALSGGADSVALLSMLRELNFDIEAVHCNFHLRGDESDRDEAFCVSLCQKKDIPLHLVHFDTRAYADLHHVSIEMAARTLRYRHFFQLLPSIGADAVCVAHHSDDSVETILMNLIRGTGIKGLTGISPKNGFVVRPLLCLSRSEIEEYIADHQLQYVTDSSNLVDDVVRNRLRLNVLPLLQSINPAVKENILRMALHLSEAQEILDKLMPIPPIKENRRSVITWQQLLSSPSFSYSLYQILAPLSFTSSQIEIVSKWVESHQEGKPVQVGKHLQSSTHRLLADREGLVIEPKPLKPKASITIPETGTYQIGDTAKIVLKEQLVDHTFVIPKERNKVALDASHIHYPLHVRSSWKGARFQPLGMSGTKLVSDYLTDIHKNLFDKQRQLLLTQSDGSILWLIGERPDHCYRVTPQTTRVLIISYDELSQK